MLSSNLSDQPGPTPAGVPGPHFAPASSFVILRRTDKPACRRRGSLKDLKFNEARVVGPGVLGTKSSLNTKAPPQPDLLCSAQALDSRRSRRSLMKKMLTVAA